MANEQNLQPFKSGYDPRRNLKGRDKLLETTLKDMGYSKSQQNDAYRILKSMTLDELKEGVDTFLEKFRKAKDEAKAREEKT